MNKILIIFILSVFVVLSCNNTERRTIRINTKGPKYSYFEIKNQGTDSSIFTFDLNGKGLYNINKIIDFIKNEYTDIPVEEKVWRFVSNCTRHLDLISKNNWLYDPVVLMNSAGGGLCGFRSAAMTNILKYLGVEARSWSIEGHVVCEVYSNGKWHIYDPDLGVIYYNEGGEICSYEELCNNPDYISKPFKVKCISGICDSLKATSQELANMYFTKEDNSLFDTDYKPFVENENINFILPSNAVLSFPLPDEVDSTMFALAKLEIPPDWNGIIEIPLILYDYHGTATIDYQNIEIKSNFNFKDIISNNTKFNYRIKIKNNQKGIILRYYINPLLFAPDSINRIELVGKNLNSLNLTTVFYDQNRSPDWKYSCAEEFVEWNRFLSDCKEFNCVKVLSKKDFLKRIDMMNNCGAFSAFEVDTSKVNRYLRSIEVNYTDKDTVFWKELEDLNKFVLVWIELLRKIK